MKYYWSAIADIVSSLFYKGCIISLLKIKIRYILVYIFALLHFGDFNILNN